MNGWVDVTAALRGILPENIRQQGTQTLLPLQIYIHVRAAAVLLHFHATKFMGSSCLKGCPAALRGTTSEGIRKRGSVRTKADLLTESAELPA